MCWATSSVIVNDIVFLNFKSVDELLFKSTAFDGNTSSISADGPANDVRRAWRWILLKSFEVNPRIWSIVIDKLIFDPIGIWDSKVWFKFDDPFGGAESVADVVELGVKVPVLIVAEISFVLFAGGITELTLKSTLQDPSASVVYLQKIGNWFDIEFCLSKGDKESNEDYIYFK